jgi:hypothetical protein
VRVLEVDRFVHDELVHGQAVVAREAHLRRPVAVRGVLDTHTGEHVIGNRPHRQVIAV